MPQEPERECDHLHNAAVNQPDTGLPAALIVAISDGTRDPATSLMGAGVTNRKLSRVMKVALVVGAELLGSPSASSQRAPTAEEYVKNVGGAAQIVAAGELVLGGQKISCGRRPTVLHTRLDDYRAAYPGFIILNPTRLEKVSTAVKLWTYAHECGHQFRGPDEELADCFAVQRGRRQGWLTPAGLDEVCRFIASAKATSMHFSGRRRCEAMRACYAERPGK